MIVSRTNLRQRVCLAFTLAGGLLSLLFAAATAYVAEHYEHILVDEVLRVEVEDYLLQWARDPATLLPRTSRLSGYRQDGRDMAPARLLPLPPGIHELDDTDGIHVGVFDTVDGRLYFVVDLSEVERIERHLVGFLVAVVLLGTGISGWLGWALAGATIAPVRRLAAAVASLPVVPQRTQLAAGVGRDELGILAQAIDGYQARLVDADSAERAFLADASHELRTPVAVVKGAVELLLDEPAADPATHRRLQRLDRGVRELTELLDVLLELVRRRSPEFGFVDAETFLRECADAVPAASDARVHRPAIEAEGMVEVPHREATLILQALIRRLLPPDAAGTLLLRAQGAEIELEFRESSAIAAGTGAVGPRRSDHGLGLTLVGRLAERLGWRIEESESDASIRVVRIHLRSDPIADMEEPA